MEFYFCFPTCRVLIYIHFFHHVHFFGINVYAVPKTMKSDYVTPMSNNAVYMLS